MLTFIPKENLKQLDNYKYNGGEYTTLDNLFNHFWNWSSKFLPDFLHPNLITLCGSIIMLSSTLLFFVFCNPLIDVVPNWLYFLK